MEDIKNLETPKPPSKEELMEIEYKKKWREIKISRMRACVLRNQIIKAYTILENVRFDFLGDTMFREYFTRAKRELEGALSDYLLSDNYWEERFKQHREMTSEEYEIKKNQPMVLQGKIK